MLFLWNSLAMSMSSFSRTSKIELTILREGLPWNLYAKSSTLMTVQVIRAWPRPRMMVMKMSSTGGTPSEWGISSSSCLTVSKRRKVQSLWIKARYVDWEWTKLGTVEAHLKYSSASEADFWSSISCETCSWLGAEDEDECVWNWKRLRKWVGEDVGYANAFQSLRISSISSSYSTFPSHKIASLSWHFTHASFFSFFSLV